MAIFTGVIPFLAVLLLHVSSWAVEKVERCPGEGCGCFNGFDNEKREPIPTVRSFQLYKDADPSSTPLKDFDAGVKAKPLRNWLVILEKGDYVVERVKGISGKGKLSPGDHLNTLIRGDDAFDEARNGSSWISFSADQVRLKTIKESIYQQWYEIEVGKLRGFVPAPPFEGCLE